MALSVAAPAALASSGALSQLPGQAACVSNTAYAGNPGSCQQGVGLSDVQSIAISPDGNSLYTAAVASDAVAAFQRNTTTGLLTQVSGGGGCVQDPSATAEAGCVTGQALQIPDWVQVSPNGANVYASSYSSQAVDVFSRNSTTGAISQPSGSTGCVSSSVSSCTSAVGLQGPGVIAFSPDGKNAYVALFGDGIANTGGVASFSVGANGALTQLGSGTGCLLDSTSVVTGCVDAPDSSLRGVGSVAVSPDGSYVYVAARVSGALTIYQRNTTTGALTRVIGAGGCVEETGISPCAQGTAAIGLEGPNSISISPDGSHVYVASFVSSGGSGMGTTVAVFSRNSTTGALTQLPGTEGCFSGGGADPACTPVPVLDGPFAVTTSPDGSSVYVTDYGSNSFTDSNASAVTVFSADSSGALTPLPGLSRCVSADGSSGNCAQGIGLPYPHETVISPDGSFAYVAGHQDSTIDVFATEPAMSVPPANNSLPAISGTPAPGQTLSATAGAWTGDETGYAYQWQDCDANGAGCTAITGAGGYTLAGDPATTSYTLGSGDVGHTIRVRVTATNSAGTTTAASSATGTVTATGPPSNTALPVITGSTVQGQTLSASTGTWTGNPTNYSYSWNQCDTSGSACARIPNTSSPTYALTAADVGHTITVSVTATNTAGSTLVMSAATATITAATHPPPRAPRQTRSGCRAPDLWA